MDLLTMLTELRLDWTVLVASTIAGWHVVLEPFDPSRQSHHYEGTDLVRVVRAAWAGEPAGRV